MKPESKPSPIGYLLLGLLFVIGPFFWAVDVGGRTLSAAEARAMGEAQVTVAMGALLIALAALLWRGALWSRWLILFWCPFSILASIGWSLIAGIGNVNLVEVGFIGVPVMLFWVWGTRRHLFGRASDFTITSD